MVSEGNLMSIKTPNIQIMEERLEESRMNSYEKQAIPQRMISEFHIHPVHREEDLTSIDRLLFEPSPKAK
eukprot:CAMPEP_0170555512 /NCGR_PEP_ID=MMETSP0211-20121228/13410_1 /TAXON_ID=311385 /ORGANISM="Pseudokeronopsis sp., Strain OXSARD2" /LENGTH=69 /DNA_ID=CAMNT_0010865405 /DNA_START=1480 /DNA_END=1689 /DNA_ORIENTATION=-